MRWSVVRRVVRRLAPRTILEIGCGQGAFGARLARVGQYLAVEPDPSSYAVARSRIQAAGGQVRNASTDALGEDETFELVCAFEVLEHLEDDLAALTSWRGLVAPGGHILLSMPAWQERFNPWDTIVGHYRRYAPNDCRELFAAAGFADVSVIVYGWPLGYATENVRSRIAARRGAAQPASMTASMQERTAGSGRLLQPKAVAGLAIQAATAPFNALQRLQPEKGTGVVVLARPAKSDRRETNSGRSGRHGYHENQPTGDQGGPEPRPDVGAFVQDQDAGRQDAEIAERVEGVRDTQGHARQRQQPGDR
ncbi:MAG: class I SAM-dependent methyltransferase [Actinomycetota bacterium]|nr:class I SAM-dependent methyltransferase [Actinomycetota bacterium]